jgi:hypothetical protein
MDPLTAKAPLFSRMKIVRTAFQSGKRRIIFGFPRRTLHHTIPSGGYSSLRLKLAKRAKVLADSGRTV